MKMQKLKHVDNFVLDHAVYRLTDGEGNEVTLFVEYAKNKYSIENKGGVPSGKFSTEVKQLAEGLLARKHGANLAEREQYI